jgi:hypothetical protein
MLSVSFTFFYSDNEEFVLIDWCSEHPLPFVLQETLS